MLGDFHFDNYLSTSPSISHRGGEDKSTTPLFPMESGSEVYSIYASSFYNLISAQKPTACVCFSLLLLVLNIGSPNHKEFNALLSTISIHLGQLHMGPFEPTLPTLSRTSSAARHPRQLPVSVMQHESSLSSLQRC